MLTRQIFVQLANLITTVVSLISLKTVTIKKITFILETKIKKD